MITKELVAYIKRCRKMGFSDRRIKEALRERGWPEKEIKKAMARHFISQRLPGWVFIATAILALAVIVFTAWQAIAILTEIHQISVDIAELTNQMLSSFKFIEQRPAERPPAETGFCGWATEGMCSTDEDCISGGCSGQVCQSTTEEPIITTCEYAECYNAQTFGVSCKCVDNKCQWIE